MISRKDWAKIMEFASTEFPHKYVGPWGWEFIQRPPSLEELLEFIRKEIGIKEHYESCANLPR